MVAGTLALPNKESNEAKKLVPPLAGQGFTMLGQVSIDFHATPQVGVSLEDTLEPSYWMAVARQLKEGCEIRVIPEDNSWYAKLLVLSTDGKSVTVAVIHHTQLTKKSTLSSEQFEIRPTQNNTRHGLFRRADGHLIKGGFVTGKQADEYLHEYLRAMAA